MSDENTPPLFAACEGLRFHHGSGRNETRLELRAGQYGPGKGARGGLQLYSEGQAWGKLTVNLPEHALADDEFFVKRGEGAQSGSTETWRTSSEWYALGFLKVTSAGLFEPVLTPHGDGPVHTYAQNTVRTVPSGYVEEYAEVWRFAKDAQTGVYRVLNPACIKALADAYQAREEELLARDAAGRLRGDHRERNYK